MSNLNKSIWPKIYTLKSGVSRCTNHLVRDDISFKIGHIVYLPEVLMVQKSVYREQAKEKIG